MYHLQIGCQLDYVARAATPSVFIVQPAPYPGQVVLAEDFTTTGGIITGAFTDAFGNRCQRVTLPAGEIGIRYEAVVAVTAAVDTVRPEARQIPLQELPSNLLRFTLPSRYAETDELLGFAWERFSRVPAGFERAQAICHWAHHNIQYRPGISAPDWSAADVIARGQGVCRDRAHVVVALCRAFNMPARYTVSYLPDIDVPDDGIPMDFHAYAEVWLDGGWHVFDPHQLTPRKGRVFIASGLDAADAAFATLYGAATLTRFKVKADQRTDQLDRVEPINRIEQINRIDPNNRIPSSPALVLAPPAFPSNEVFVAAAAAV